MLGLECVESQLETIQEACIALFSQMFPSGNLPSTFPPDKDKLVQWCHGSPGAIYLSLRCARVFRDRKFLYYAKLMGDDVWERGLLKKGSGLCHGIAGNAYSFLALYNFTNDRKYLYYAYKVLRYLF